MSDKCKDYDEKYDRALDDMAKDISETVGNLCNKYDEHGLVDQTMMAVLTASVAVLGKRNVEFTRILNAVVETFNRTSQVTIHAMNVPTPPTKDESVH